MRLIVFSDSHGTDAFISAVMSRMAKNADIAIHLGDGFRDLERLRVSYPSLELITVSGNSDISYGLPTERVLELSGKKVFITHGNRYGVKTDLTRLYYAATERGADICLFGHTHVPLNITENGILFFNPGSIGHARNGGTPSYGVIDISEGNALARVNKYG